MAQHFDYFLNTIPHTKSPEVIGYNTAQGNVILGMLDVG